MITFKNVNPNILDKLILFGFKKTATKSPYELFRLIGPCHIILFNSRKLVLQGKKEDIDEISRILISLGYEQDIKIKKNDIDKNIENIKKISNNINIEIGSDETLKGDTFGGLIVAGTLINESDKKKIEELKIKDSKEIKDENIDILATKIKYILGIKKISVRILTPEEYNKTIKKNNITEILNKLHSYVQRELKEKNNVQNMSNLNIKTITDKYPGCNVGDIIVQKAENKYLSVAAASIIARNNALIQIRKLSEMTKIKIPLGSTHVKKALEEIVKRKLEPEKLVKMNFKNVKEFFNKS